MAARFAEVGLAKLLNPRRSRAFPQVQFSYLLFAFGAPPVKRFARVTFAHHTSTQTMLSSAGFFCAQTLYFHLFISPTMIMHLHFGTENDPNHNAFVPILGRVKVVVLKFNDD